MKRDLKKARLASGLLFPKLYRVAREARGLPSCEVYSSSSSHGFVLGKGETLSREDSVGISANDPSVESPRCPPVSP